MGDFALSARWPIPHHPLRGRDGLLLTSRPGVALVHVAARRGQTPALAAAVRAAYGLDLPETPRRIEGSSLAFAWAGSDQWLAMTEDSGRYDLESELRAATAGLASVSDQSDGRAVMRLSGPRARDVLAKLIPIDFHPRAFQPGHVAITHASHIGVIVWQLDDVPAYEIAPFRSLAGSLWRWLGDAGAEFGFTQRA